MIEVLFGGLKIADYGKLSVNGNGNAIIRTLPNTKGALIKPSNNPTRNIAVNCFANIANKNRNQIELIQYSLSRYLASCNLSNRDLKVNDNIYTNVSIDGNTFQTIIHNEYYMFRLGAILDNRQSFLQSQIPVPSSAPRIGNFEYTFFNIDGSSNITNFPIIQNYEATASIDFIQKQKPRISYDDGIVRGYEAGFHSIKLDCWISGCLVKDMESYFVNALIGPLGRQGTLSISGRTFTDAVLNNFTSQEHHGCTARYSMEFVTNLC